ncbi:hypothetical protein D3C86_350930 [compost metagenome]
MTNAFQGFNLFNDIEDKILRIRNRAVVLSNIYEDNSKDGKINGKGAAIMLGYFGRIPEAERAMVQDKFIEDMKLRGFKIG